METTTELKPANAWPDCPFTIKTETVKHDKGWDTSKVHIHEGDKKVGEYHRGYQGALQDTFYPFQHFGDGKWYALYSADYTTIRVMSLPDCKDIAGTEPAGNGFCPVELYVPTLRDIDEDVEMGWTPQDLYKKLQEHELEMFGFMAGCTWGDDTSWKIRFIPNVLKPEPVERFGYIHLPSGIRLKDAVSFRWFDLEDGALNINVAHMDAFHAVSGQKVT